MKCGAIFNNTCSTRNFGAEDCGHETGRTKLGKRMSREEPREGIGREVRKGKNTKKLAVVEGTGCGVGGGWWSENEPTWSYLLDVWVNATWSIFLRKRKSFCFFVFLFYF